MKCFYCVQQGDKSTLRVISGYVSTDLAVDEFWDEEGNSHRHDPNTTTAEYQCSRGHRFPHTSGRLAVCCDWKPERILAQLARGQDSHCIDCGHEFASSDWNRWAIRGAAPFCEACYRKRMPDHSMPSGLTGAQAAEWILTHSALSAEEIEAVRKRMAP